MQPSPPMDPSTTPLQSCSVQPKESAVCNQRHSLSSPVPRRRFNQKRALDDEEFGKLAAPALQPHRQEDGEGRSGLGREQRRLQSAPTRRRRRGPSIGPKIIQTAPQQNPELPTLPARRFPTRPSMGKKAGTSADGRRMGKVVDLAWLLALIALRECVEF